MWGEVIILSAIGITLLVILKFVTDIHITLVEIRNEIIKSNERGESWTKTIHGRK